MSNCCIPYKQLNNIDGSSQVTLNGKISFDGIDELEAIDIVCDNLSASTIDSGTIIASVIYSTDIQTDTLEANTATITIINSVHINNTEDINTDTLNSVHINNTEAVNTNTLEAITSVTAANIQIKQDTITTIDDESNINVSISAGNGSITLNTFDNGTTGVSEGNIELNVYGKGNISLTPTKSGEAGQETIGVVNIGTLEFSVDSTDNSIIKQTTENKSISINSNGSGSVNIESISINGSSITSSSDYIDINKPVRLHDGSDYVSFLPQSGVQQIYTWPSPPFLLPLNIYLLTSDASGNLSWERQLLSPILHIIDYDLTYLTTDTSGELSWKTTTVPSNAFPIEDPPKEVEVGPYLTSDSSGELSWDTSTLIIIGEIPVPVFIDSKLSSIVDSENNITIKGKKYKIPLPTVKKKK